MGSKPDGSYVRSNSRSYSKILNYRKFRRVQYMVCTYLTLVAMPVSLFLVKQFVDGIPDALIEAAVVDGAGDITILRKVIIPLTNRLLQHLWFLHSSRYGTTWKHQTTILQTKH